jgi:glucokinase
MTLGIDIGGTYLRYEIREGKRCLQLGVLKSTEMGLYAFMEKMLKKEKNIATVAISYAGQVQNGTIVSAPHIAVDETDIKTMVESNYDVELLIENDLNCAVIAEASYYDCDTIAALSVGTGLGLGVIDGGRLIRGKAGIATELGHMPYKESLFVCSCGKRNCIELYCSGSGLARWKKWYGLDPSLTLEALQQSSQRKAQKIYEVFYEALFHAAGTAVTLFNPQILVLGGGIGKNEALRLKIEENLAAYALPLAAKDLKIVLSELKNASLEGAFLLKEYHV